MSAYEAGRFPVTENDRLLFQHAAYIADPCTKRIIDTRDSSIAFSDFDLIQQGLAKLRGERPMNAPRLPAEQLGVDDAPSLMGEIEELAREYQRVS